MSAARLALIDDQKEVREALGEMLRVFGYTVDLYTSATEFLAQSSARSTMTLAMALAMTHIPTQESEYSWH